MILRKRYQRALLLSWKPAPRLGLSLTGPDARREEGGAKRVSIALHQHARCSCPCTGVVRSSGCCSDVQSSKLAIVLDAVASMHQGVLRETIACPRQGRMIVFDAADPNAARVYEFSTLIERANLARQHQQRSNGVRPSQPRHARRPSLGRVSRVNWAPLSARAHR